MNTMLYVSLFLFTLISFILPIIYWRSKKNINFFISIPMTMIAYIFGGMYFIDKAKKEYGIDDSTMEFCAIILLLGTIVYILCFTVGANKKGIISNTLIKIIDFLWTDRRDLKKKYIRAGEIFALLSVACLAGSFIGIGFIPIFSENPMMAKYMGGEYQNLYKAYAVPYRLGLDLSSISVPLLAAGFITKKTCKGKILDVLLLLLQILVLVGTMRRGMIVSGIITVIFIYMSYKKTKDFFMLTLVYILFFCFGSASNGILLYILGLSDSISLEEVFKGAPDVEDQLFFLQCWLDGHYDFTYGMNIIGGLIPFHSQYNLASYTLEVTGSQAGQVASGGFRLLIPLVGYITLGWIGVVLICGVAAYFMGIVLRIQQHYLSSCTMLDYIIFYSFMTPIINLIQGFMISIGIDTACEVAISIITMIIIRYKIRLIT